MSEKKDITVYAFGALDPGTRLVAASAIDAANKIIAELEERTETLEENIEHLKGTPGDYQELMELWKADQKKIAELEAELRAMTELALENDADAGKAQADRDSWKSKCAIYEAALKEIVMSLEQNQRSNVLPIARQAILDASKIGEGK